MVKLKTLKAMREAFSMTKQRCYNPRNRDYAHYGGRGITICQRWLDSFDNFVTDMGLRPEGMTLERKNNSKGYSKSNCIWAPRSTQSNNTRQCRYVSWEGITDTVAGWERRKGWKPGVLKARLNALGYSVEQAMTKPVRSGAVLPDKTYKRSLSRAELRQARGLLRTSSVQQIAVRFGVAPNTLSKLLKEL